MTLRRSAPHAKGRWSALVAVTAVMLLVVAQAAMATLSGGTTFNGIDGNLIVDASPAGNTDWCNQTQAQLGTGACPAANLAPSFSGKQDKPSGTGDDSFGQGSKEDTPCPTEVSGSIPPNKSDLTRFYVAHEKVGSNTYLYLAWERTNVLGNANMDFEFNQSKVLCPATNELAGSQVPLRTANDLLVTYDFGGSGAPVLSLRVWTGSSWGAPTLLNSTNSEGAVNTGTVNDPIAVTGGPGPRQLAAGTFGEASINLSAVLPNIFGSNPSSCESFGSAYLKSRSSSSFTSEPKDFIAPAQVTISNCGTIKITKHSQNGDGTFDYTSTGGLPSPADGSGNFSITTASGTATSTFSNVLGGQTYTVTESGPSGGFSFVSLSCSNTGGSTSSTSGQVATIGMASGGEVECTYTNHINLQPTLSTSLSDTSVLNTDTVTDTATLADATAHASGVITISAYSGTGSGACIPTNLVESHAATPATDGNGPYSADFGPLAAGHYEFQAVIAADANNLTASSTCGDEPLTVQNAPSASTIQNLIPNDRLNLSGATLDAGGHVDFYLFSPSQTCSVANEGIAAFKFLNIGLTTFDHASTSNSTAVTAVGTWHWLAVYSGDAKNQSATSLCTETFNITN